MRIFLSAVPLLMIIVIAPTKLLPLVVMVTSIEQLKNKHDIAETIVEMKVTLTLALTPTPTLTLTLTLPFTLALTLTLPLTRRSPRCRRCARCPSSCHRRSAPRR